MRPSPMAEDEYSIDNEGYAGGGDDWERAVEENNERDKKRGMCNFESLRAKLIRRKYLAKLVSGM